MQLYRPVGLEELRLIAEAQFLRFPPRLPEQPIFYPVLSVEYARKIAADWNTQVEPFLGFVTQFEVETEFAASYPSQTAGSSAHKELWVPADDLAEFNRHIVGPIRVIEAYAGPDSPQAFNADTNLPQEWTYSVPFSAKSPDEVVETYSPSDNRRIAFDWNGKHGDDFHDANFAFRTEVLARVFQDIDRVPAALIRDLFTAVTARSREAWSIDARVGKLAMELLGRSPEEFIVDYLKGSVQGFDAGIATSVGGAPTATLERCLDEIRRRIESTTDQKQLQLLRFGEDRFKSWLGAEN